MWNNYLKISLRNIFKYKLHSFINITGLSIGIALSILIFLFIADEISFDQFHAKKELLYRMEAKQYSYGGEKSIFDEDGDGIWRFAWMPTPLGPAISDEIPEIANFTRWETGTAIVMYGDKVFKEDVSYVDPGFFSMFDFKLINGAAEKVLEDKSQVVITESFRDKYFSDKDPVGEIIQLEIFNEVQNFLISGIIENPPQNSSLTYNLLVRQENRPWYEESNTQWQSFNNPTFIELSPHADTEQFYKKLRIFEKKYFEKEMKEAREKQSLDEDVPVFELLLQPFTSIHLDKEISWHQSSDPAYSRILGAIGLLILLIASINYISLSLSNSSSRAKEVGIRKVMGAGPSSLTGQFWGESMILVFFALAVGILLSAILLDPFNGFTGKSLTLFNQYSFSFLLFLIFLVILIGVIAGGYPAIYLSRFQPVKVLKTKTSTKFNTVLIRGLVIVQYSLSAFLIISSMIMYRQMSFVTTRDLGYNKDQVLVVPTFTGWTDEGETTVERLSQALEGNRGVIRVTGTSSSFNQGWSRNGFEIDGEDHSAYTYRIHEGYLETLGLELLQGRDFDPYRPSDTRDAILVNEALVKDFGWDQPVGEHLYWREDSSAHLVIGVVKNYHFLSLENEIEPVILYFNPGQGKLTTALIKISPLDIPGTMSHIEKTWKSLNPNKPFEYSFLDEDVSRQYSNYQQWMKIMGVSTLLAIFIACLGLFGLSGINAINRLKEVSIRKVFGATINQLFLLMNREVLILSLIAFLVAIPLSYYVMAKWLQSFQYKIGLTLPVFLIPLLAGILIAVVTVSYHALRVSNANPAEILKDE